jgi:hypothetical protein
LQTHRLVSLGPVPTLPRHQYNTMHSAFREYPLTREEGHLSGDAPSNASVFVAHPNISSSRSQGCEYTNLGITGLSSQSSTEHPIDNLQNGLRECASWLTDRLILANPHRQAELCSRIRSSSSKLKRSATWIHGLVFPHWRIRDLQLLSDTLFTENYSWITTCIMLIGQFIERRPWDFSVKSKALLPLVEVFSLLQEVQKVRLEILWGARSSKDDSGFVASHALPRTSFPGPVSHSVHGTPSENQLRAWHSDFECPSDCTEDCGSQVASGLHHCSDKRIERLQVSQCISETKIAAQLCHDHEPDAKYRLVNRVERLQASKAAIEVKTAMRLVLRNHPGVWCYNTLLPRTLEED